ncbi:copper homeostasis protein cutC homolog [Pomacea canaliculata]|uniref:copper homeostasis protein cutC homolog n=1 Tax=Pomacea canaliculata TaxID=400727 RepID=UPI000D72E1C8|nr:copper homeostasis protein cutC homolog [Pomacea canaliculata]
MEVCVDSVISAINAEKGGASRLELCSNLMEGGTTPTIGMLQVVKSKVKIPVFVMIRPRGGDFLYTEEEVEVMKHDIHALKENGADGFVFGFLQEDGSVDSDRCKTFIELISPLPVTFHRAIDMCNNMMVALRTLIDLKFDRVLTSGGAANALDGAAMIDKMITEARGNIIVVPGGGINEDNLERILQIGAKEFHCSARIFQESNMLQQKSGITLGGSLSPPEYGHRIASLMKVNNMMNIASMCWESLNK